MVKCDHTSSAHLDKSSVIQTCYFLYKSENHGLKKNILGEGDQKFPKSSAPPSWYFLQEFLEYPVVIAVIIKMKKHQDVAWNEFMSLCETILDRKGWSWL